MYIDTLTRPRITFIRNALTAVGAQLPRPVIAAQAEFDKVAAASRDYEPATRDQINEAVADALADDRDPADDERVRHLVTSHALVTEAGLNVNYAAGARIVDALTTQADKILAMWAEPAAEAGRQLAEAHQLLGEERDPAIIMGQGIKAVDAWTNARRAEDLLRTIDKAWVALAHLTGFASPDADPVLRLCDASLQTFDEAGRKAKPSDIVRADGTISLADRTTHRERRVRIVDERQRREDGKGDAFSAEHRRLRGSGVA